MYYLNFLDNLCLLEGKIISNPFIVKKNKKRPITKFLFKIPSTDYSDEITAPGTYQVVSLFAYDNFGKYIKNRFSLNDQLIVLGRLMTIRSRKKIFKDEDIPEIIRILSSNKKKYLNGSKAKRKAIREKILKALPTKIYPGKNRVEIMILRIINIKSPQSFRNMFFSTGQIPNQDIKVSNNWVIFNYKIKRIPDINRIYKIKDLSKFDNLRVKANLSQHIKTIKEKTSKEVNISGNLYVSTNIFRAFDNKKVDKLLREFKHMNPKDNKRFKNLINQFTKLKKVPYKKYDLRVLARDII